MLAFLWRIPQSNAARNDCPSSLSITPCWVRIRARMVSCLWAVWPASFLRISMAARRLDRSSNTSSMNDRRVSVGVMPALVRAWLMLVGCISKRLAMVTPEYPKAFIRTISAFRSAKRARFEADIMMRVPLSYRWIRYAGSSGKASEVETILRDQLMLVCWKSMVSAFSWLKQTGSGRAPQGHHPK